MGKHTIVVGGGISGLAAALGLIDAGHRVTLLEGSPRLGGKLLTAPDGLEAGAENFLMRDPAGGPSAAVRLVEQLGLGDELIHPVGLPAGLYVDGKLGPLPPGTMMGIPAEPGPDAHDADQGHPVLAAGQDVAVGELVRERLGGKVVDELVDPLLGGVYAGRADQLSVAATMPGLHRLLQVEHTLTGAVRKVVAGSRAHSGGPVFGTVSGGLSRLVGAAQAALVERGGQVRLGAPVKAFSGTRSGWDLAGQSADCLVLAVPAGKAARLAPTLPIPNVEYASVALVTLVLPDCELPELSGFLVPATEGLTIKAATFFSRKWPGYPAGTQVVRLSIGRSDDVASLQHSDDTLISVARRDLATVLGHELPEPLLARVQRWGGGLPQYEPGHLDRVARLREAVAGLPIAFAGAGYDGIGIPACVNSGLKACEKLAI